MLLFLLYAKQGAKGLSRGDPIPIIHCLDDHAWIAHYSEVGFLLFISSIFSITTVVIVVYYFLAYFVLLLLLLFVVIIINVCYNC